jgi:predicted GIY-YIG superfamily endonuclease
VHYVYLLQSLSHPNQRYIGLTSDLKARLAKHNAGHVSHTSKFFPWKLHTYVAFSTREQAAEFERYLKSGSGRAFANRHLWPKVSTDERERGAVL